MIYSVDMVFFYIYDVTTVSLIYPIINLYYSVISTSNRLKQPTTINMTHSNIYTLIRYYIIIFITVLLLYGYLKLISVSFETRTKN